LVPGTIETWYDNWNTSSFELAGNTIYARNIGVAGVPADHILALGVEIDGQLHAASVQSGVLSQKELKIEGVSNGTYSICTYAKIMLNGHETVLKGDVKTITVTPIPTATYNVYTSYSNNGGKSLRNDVYGNEIRARVDLSDVYIQSNFVKSATFTYGGSTANLTPGQEWKTTLGYGAHSTSIKVVLKNGYTLTSGNYTSHVTGIPFTMNVSSNTDGWSISGTHKWSSGELRLGNSSTQGATTATKTFHMPANTSVKMDIRGKVTTSTLYTNTFKASISDSGVFSAEAVGKTFSAPTTSFDEKGKVGTMTNGNPTVSLRNSSDVASRASYIYALSLQYNL
jgi:hypothetical protein